jgi:hypothetical protein
MDITLSTVYYDVDYANNPNVAVNFDAIMKVLLQKQKSRIITILLVEV